MRYMLAVDGKQPAEKASQFLLKFLRPGDVLFIVFVQSELSFLESLGDREELIKARAKYADDLGARYVAEFGESGVEVRFDTYTGDAREVVCDKAGERQVDILVVGHRGLGMVQRAVMGSVSEYLVKNAPCSVLVV